VADRYATRFQGARLAMPAVFLFVGTSLFTASYALRTSETHVERPPAVCASVAEAQRIDASVDPEDRQDCADFKVERGGVISYEPIRRPTFDAAVFGPAFAMQLVGIFVVSMAIPGLRAGLTDALPAHLRGAGFGAFNLIAVVFGQAAAPFIVAWLSSRYDDNLRTAFLLVSPLSFLGAAVLFRARKFLDDDMQKIMMAVLQAMQHERDRIAETAAEQGKQPGVK